MLGLGFWRLQDVLGDVLEDGLGVKVDCTVLLDELVVVGEKTLQVG